MFARIFSVILHGVIKLLLPFQLLQKMWPPVKKLTIPRTPPLSTRNSHSRTSGPTIPTAPITNPRSPIPPTPRPLIKPPPAPPAVKPLQPPSASKPVISKPPKRDQPRQGGSQPNEMVKLSETTSVKRHSNQTVKFAIPPPKHSESTPINTTKKSYMVQTSLANQAAKVPSETTKIRSENVAKSSEMVNRNGNVSTPPKILRQEAAGKPTSTNKFTVWSYKNVNNPNEKQNDSDDDDDD